MWESVSPTGPPNTRPAQTGQVLRTASVPRAERETNTRVGPLKVRSLAAKAMNGMKPEPEALRQSAQ
ncbi:hypothetical protein D3C86_2249280 [compost metagenome]